MLQVTLVSSSTGRTVILPGQYHSGEEIMSILPSILLLEENSDIDHYHFSVAEMSQEHINHFGVDYCTIVETEYYSVEGFSMGFADYPAYPDMPSFEKAQDFSRASSSDGMPF